MKLLSESFQELIHLQDVGKFSVSSHPIGVTSTAVFILCNFMGK